MESILFGIIVGIIAGVLLVLIGLLAASRVALRGSSENDLDKMFVSRDWLVHHRKNE